jgi:drug/metabolite transporter (DMT)-like permease
MPEPTVSINVHIRLILTMIFWGGTFVAGRLLAEELHPVTASTLRFILASAMLLSAILIRDKKLPCLSKKQWGAMSLLGLTGVFAYNIFFFTGLQTVEAGRASLIIAINPVITTFLAILLFGERCNFRRSIGMVLSVSGAFIVISKGNPANLFQGNMGGMGETYMIGCVISWSAYTLIGKKLLKNVEPLVAVAYSCSTGAIFLLIAALFSGHLAEIKNLTAEGIGCLFYFAFFGTTLGFIWFYDGVKKLGASRAVMYVNLVPVSGILFGTLLLGEHLESSLLIGGTCVFSGIYLINQKQTTSKQM